MGGSHISMTAILVMHPAHNPKHLHTLERPIDSRPPESCTTLLGSFENLLDIQRCALCALQCFEHRQTRLS